MLVGISLIVIRLPVILLIFTGRWVIVLMGFFLLVECFDILGL